MHRKLFPILFTFFFCLLLVRTLSAEDRTLRIPLPKKSKYTPVQQLNRDGVQALKKHDVNKAKRLFYKAYLIDPNDPFTLNNLGYVSELEGDSDRAQRFYDQAQTNTSDAVVDRSTVKEVEGKAVAAVAGRTAEGPMKVNRMNSEAISLLKKDRAPEADLVLQQALKLDPRNPFTLNNMGFAKEKEGELEQAIQYYNQAAMTGSRDSVIIAINSDWRGKPISEIAARNADKARQEMSKADNREAQVVRLNLRGVSAMNRNDRKKAREYFQQAYKLDSKNAFALNNMGYLAEMDGDKETAQDFYERAREAQRANARVAVSTRPEVEGRPLAQLAQQSDSLVETRMQAEVLAKRQTKGAPALHTRDNRIIVDKPAPPKPKEENPDSTPPQQR
ncbi:MAG TPA: tetratricopeptide repeat protein [Candidatus Angelobacter sp.]